MASSRTVTARPAAAAPTAPKRGAAASAATEEPAPKEKKEREPKVKFRDVVDKAKLNSAGLLTVVPSFGDEYNPKEMERLEKSEFASEDLFLDHQGNLFTWRAEQFAKRGERFHKEAAATRKFGDPEKRKKLKRAQKLQDQLALLMKQLEAEGITDDAEVELDDADAGA